MGEAVKANRDTFTRHLETDDGKGYKGEQT